MEARKAKSGTHALNFTQLVKFLLLGVLLASTIFFINQFQLGHYFPIKTVRIYGGERIEHQEIQELLTPMVARGFFAVDVDRIRERLMQLSWVGDIFVRRNWPDRVDVTIIEKEPVAQWNDGSLLSDTGELFMPKADTYPQGLPRLFGPAGQQIIMLGYFRDINRILVPIHAKIATLELTSYLTWKLRLTNGVSMHLGDKDILTRLTHFVKVYPKIVGDHAADVEYIDLRYPNGVAVQWKAASVKT